MGERIQPRRSLWISEDMPGELSPVKCSIRPHELSTELGDNILEQRGSGSGQRVRHLVCVDDSRAPGAKEIGR